MLRMSPEFVSGRMEKDWHTTDRLNHNRRTSPTRTNVRYRSDKNRNVVSKDILDSSSKRTSYADDRDSRHKLQHVDSDRRPRTDQSRSSPLESRYKEEHTHSNKRTWSRSPGHRRFSSDNYRHREERSNPLSWRHTDNFSLQRNASPRRSSYRDRSSCGKSSTAQNIRPSEDGRHYRDIDARHSAGNSGSRKYEDTFHSSDDRVHQSQCLYADDRRTSGARTSSRQHSDEHIADDSSSSRRRCSHSDRRSHTESHDYHDSCHGFQCHDRQAGSACAECLCHDNIGHNRTLIVCDHCADRTNCHSSPVLSRDKLNSPSCRDGKGEDGRMHNSDRRSSSKHDSRYISADDTNSLFRKSNDSDGQHSAGQRDDPVSKNRGTSKSSTALPLEGPNSNKQKLSTKCHESVPCCDIMSVTVTSADHNVPCCSSSELWSHVQMCGSFSSRSDPCLVSPTDNKQHTTVNAQIDNSCALSGSKIDTGSSGSEYCLATSWSALPGGYQLVNSSNSVAASHLLMPQWPESAVMAKPTSTDSSRPQHCAATQLPLLPTTMSAVPTGIDPRKSRVSGISVNSNSLSSFPSNATFNPAGVQPLGAGPVGQYMMDSVYGDSPLLDEPVYHSPLTATHSSSLKLGGSSGSSMNYVLPELIDNMELKKMLDVVTFAKTTLEQTLPPSCQTDPLSVKQQKVCFSYQNFVSILSKSVFVLLMCWLFTL